MRNQNRVPGTLPSNIQPNPKPSVQNKKYIPPNTRNEHVNAISTRSGKVYDSPTLNGNPSVQVH